jgi:hypothetical protein
MFLEIQSQGLRSNASVKDKRNQSEELTTKPKVLDIVHLRVETASAKEEFSLEKSTMKANQPQSIWILFQQEEARPIISNQNSISKR